MRSVIHFIFISLFMLNNSFAQSIRWTQAIDTNRTNMYSPNLCFEAENPILTSLREKTSNSGFYNNLIVAEYFDVNGNVVYKKEYKPYNSVSIQNASILNVESSYSNGNLFNKGYFSTTDSNYFFISIINRSSNKLSSLYFALKSGETIPVSDFTDGKIEIFISNAFNDTLIYKSYDENFTLIDYRKINLVTDGKILKFKNNQLYLINSDESGNNFISYNLYKYDKSGTLINSRRVSNIIETQAVPNNFFIQDVAFINDKLLIKAKHTHKNNNPNIPNFESNLTFAVFDTSDLSFEYIYSLNDPNTLNPVHIPDNGQSFMFKDNKLSVLCKNITNGSIQKIFTYSYQNGNLLFRRELVDTSLIAFNFVSANSTQIVSNNIVNVYNYPSNTYLIETLDLNGNLLLSSRNTFDSTVSFGLILSSQVNSNYLYLIGSLNYSAFTDNDISISQFSNMFNYVNTIIEPPINIYPNPSANTFTVDVNDVKTLTLYNTLGAKIKAISYTNKINVEGLPNGMYYLQIITKQNEHYSEKVIVQK